MTELSEYTPREGSEEHMAMLERRVHPRLPRKRLLCFYPMSKRREGADNWYLLDYDQRRELMGGHGKLGAKFSGRVIQLITGATGLSDWEWGVTLIADDPKDIKDIVYEMRFDEVSARYGVFGPFTVGLVMGLREALGSPGRRWLRGRCPPTVCGRNLVGAPLGGGAARGVSDITRRGGGLGRVGAPRSGCVGVKVPAYRHNFGTLCGRSLR